MKKELDKLQKKIEVLESKAKAASNNKNHQAHAKNIVESLKARLLEVTKDFKDALESRTKALEQQDRRRQMYSAGSSAANNPFAQMQQRPSGNAGDLEGGGGATQGGGQQTQLYHNSRAEAVQSVQRTIGELATMFQKMATMVTALVTRIAATSKSQIASDSNRNAKKSLRLRKHPLKPTLWTREPPVLCGFYSVSEAPHGSGNPPEYVATTRV